MTGWTLIDTHPTQGRTFQRPLGATEQSFFWTGLIDGRCDILRYNEIRLLNGDQDAALFSDANITRAWISTKRRHPLAGAVVEWKRQGLGTDLKDEDSKCSEVESSKLRFLVRESDLSVLRPREIVFGEVADAEEAEKRAAAIPNGPRPLSEELLIQVGIFRETGSERSRADVLHVTVHMSHFIADGTASRSLVRCFLDTLARGGSQPEPTQVPLEDRLAMVIPFEDLKSAYLSGLSPARQRWRRAIAAVIVRLRFARNKGGHTLPCRIIKTQKATRSMLVETLLTPAQTSAVIAKCRQHKVTFGNAYLPLAQVAMTRVLYRRYLRGEISEEEWTFRKRQPHINCGPVNMRPYLDKAWLDKGGGGELIVSMHIYTYELPFMTLGGTEDDTKRVLSDGAPPFSDLLSFGRFLHRAGLVKKQATAFFNHPLFLELKDALGQIAVTYQESGALQWLKSIEAGTDDPNGNAGDSEEEVLAAMDIPSIKAHSGSSIGNMDPLFPFEYPLPPTHALSPYSSVSHPSKAGYVVPLPSALTDPELDMAPTIAAECAKTRNHALPGELSLGAETWRGQLKLYVCFDGNVYEEAVVREWLDEVKGAVLWYLD